MAHSFIELDKAVVHVIRLVSFLWLWFSVSLPSDGEEWDRLTEGITGSCFHGQGCVPSLLFDLRTNLGGGIEDNGDLLQKVPCMHCPTLCP